MNEENKNLKDGIEITDPDAAEIDDAMGLDTLLGSSDTLAPVKAKKGMTAKHKIMIAVFAALAVALLIVYLVVLKPIFDEKQAENNDNTKNPEPMIEGEVRASNGISILMYPHIERAGTQSVTVVNPDPITGGKFTLLRGSDEDSSFYIKEHGKFAPIKGEKSLEIITAAGYTVISRRVEENATDLARYGLSEGDYPIRVTIETRQGSAYTYYIGDLIPAEGGYYCRAEGRNAVYILSRETISVLTSSSAALLHPILGPQIEGTDAAMIDSFVLSKNGQQFVAIEFTELNTDNISKSSYKMVYPAGYVVNDEKYGSNLLVTLGTLQGYMVVAAGDGTAEGMLYKNAELMAQYGFYDTENPPYDVYYEYGDIAAYIMFTESGTEGYYYAYSLIYDTIVLIEKSSASFLEWDLLEYVNKRLFFEYVKDVSSLSVSGKITYQGNQHEINTKVSYWYSDDGAEMYAQAVSYGSETKTATYQGRTEAQNHALAYYMVALSMDIEGYISDVPGFTMDGKEEYARFTVKFMDSTERTYVFYEFGNYCYFTINGSGDFYVSKTAVNKLLVNSVRAAYSHSIDIQKEYPVLPESFIGQN